MLMTLRYNQADFLFIYLLPFYPDCCGNAEQLEIIL